MALTLKLKVKGCAIATKLFASSQQIFQSDQKRSASKFSQYYPSTILLQNIGSAGRFLLPPCSFGNITTTTISSAALLQTNNGSSSSTNTANFGTSAFQQNRQLRRQQADSIRDRVPKALTALNLYVKENYKKDNDDDEQQKQQQPKTAAKKSVESPKAVLVFKSLVEDFKNLSTDEAEAYKNRATVTQEAHQKALKSLSDREKRVLLFDSRRKLLKRKITILNKRLNTLKQSLQYPGAPTGGTSYALFVKDLSKNDQQVSQLKSITDISARTAQLWKSLEASKKAEYEKLRTESAQKARLQYNQWREKVSKNPDTKTYLEEFDRLKSDIRKLRFKSSKLDRLEDEDGNPPSNKRRIVKKSKAVKKKKKVAVKARRTKKLAASKSSSAKLRSKKRKISATSTKSTTSRSSKTKSSK